MFLTLYVDSTSRARWNMSILRGFMWLTCKVQNLRRRKDKGRPRIQNFGTSTWIRRCGAISRLSWLWRFTRSCHSGASSSCVKFARIGIEWHVNGGALPILSTNPILCWFTKTEQTMIMLRSMMTSWCFRAFWHSTSNSGTWQWTWLCGIRSYELQVYHPFSVEGLTFSTDYLGHDSRYQVFGAHTRSVHCIPRRPKTSKTPRVVKRSMKCHPTCRHD